MPRHIEQIESNCSKLMKELAKKVDGKVYPNYSGRGMFGKTCWAISCGNSSVEKLYELSEELNLPSPLMDNLGYDYIVYWRELKESQCGVIKPLDACKET